MGDRTTCIALIRDIRESITIFGEHEPKNDRSVSGRCQPRPAALMADGHLGYVMPIGGVAAYKEEVSVVGVGFDIACGNDAIRTDLKYTPPQRRELVMRYDRVNRFESGSSPSIDMPRRANSLASSHSL